MPIQKRHNLNQTDRTVTVCRFIGWKPDTSRRIYDASRQQAAAHNRAVEHLLDQPETPLRKSSKQGAAGLQGLWLDWRAEGSGLDEILQAIWRPGVALAKTRVDAWEGKNAEDAAAVLQAGTADENNKKASRTGERRIDPKSLFIRRKLRDRRCANRLVIHEGVRLMDPNHLRVPGVGVVALREPLPADFRATSATLVERTPAARRQNQKRRPEDRGWKIHVQTRVPAPLKDLPDEPATVGIDHGVVHALTTNSNRTGNEHLEYSTPEATTKRRFDALDRRKKRAKRGSRRRLWLQRRQNRMRRRTLNRRDHQRRWWANRIAREHDLVGIELLQNANMRRSARGTNENPGTNVRAKSGLNRRLAASTPGRQTTELVAACVRAGTRYRLVPAAGTSITCSLCGHRDRKNRETQAAFRCRSRNQESNADVNAASNMRLFAEAYTWVGVSRPWTVAAVQSAEARRRKARRAKGVRKTAGSSTVPETAAPSPGNR